jgi:ATP-dependent protease HslVU (ClpYQ) peptidase subunit
MTCIVGIELNGKVFIGGDSAGVSGLDITARSDSKVFKIGSTIFGFTSSFRMGQLLRYKLVIPTQKVDQDDYDFLCTDFIDAVIRTLESNGYSKIKENEKIGGTFIVAYKNKVYVIYDDFQVGHSLIGYCAVGCGADYALGAMTALLKSSKDGRLIAEYALEIAAQHSAGVCAPFLVLTGDDK